MRFKWLFLSLLGYLVTFIPMMKYSVDTGNFLYWLDPAATIELLYGSVGIASFSNDLFFTVFLVLTMLSIDGSKKGVKGWWICWPLALLFGIAGTLPLYLHLREESQITSQERK